METSKSEKILTFDGGLWDWDKFEIHFDQKFDEDDTIKCKHSIVYNKGISKIYPDESMYVNGVYDRSKERIGKKIDLFIIPRVLVLYNQAGHSSAGACADCIYEAVQSIKDAENDFQIIIES